MYSCKLCLIIRHYNTLHVAVLLSSVGVLQTQPVPANPSAFFLAAQGRSDGLDSFWGQQSRREIREQKQTELRKRRGTRGRWWRRRRESCQGSRWPCAARNHLLPNSGERKPGHLVIFVHDSRARCQSTAEHGYVHIPKRLFLKSLILDQNI